MIALPSIPLPVPMPEDCADFAARRIAILGAGGVAAFAHLPAYLSLGLEVAALVDPDPAGIERARKALPPGAQPHLLDGLDALAGACRAERIDLIDIALPSQLHEGAIDEILDRMGRDCPPILVQKPVAQTAAAARRLQTRADGLGVRLFVNLNARYVPTFRKARDLVREGAIGLPLSGCVLNRGLNAKGPDQWRGKLTRLILWEMAIHHIDLLMWMFDAPVLDVQAVAARIPGLGVVGENVATVLMRFASGASATLVEDWACADRRLWRYHPDGEEILITGTEGTLSLTPSALSLVRGNDRKTWHSVALWFPDAFAGPIAEALTALSLGRPSPLDGGTCLGVLDVLEAAYAAASSGQATPPVAA
ncbi:MAG: Gfo/Idh/MocA family oxidoreductase [Pseudomonadota bacterium]